MQLRKTLSGWAFARARDLFPTLAGPTNVHPRILAAQALPMVGYFQPPLLDIMNEIQTGLRQAAPSNCTVKTSHVHAQPGSSRWSPAAAGQSAQSAHTG